MNKLNINVAINLNGGEEVIDCYGNPQRLSVKGAFELASDPNYLFGLDYPEWADILKSDEQLTKKEFKKRYSSLRTHYRMVSLGSESGIYGRNI